jgi:hypothetical protein
MGEANVWGSVGGGLRGHGATPHRRIRKPPSAWWPRDRLALGLTRSLPGSVSELDICGFRDA